MKSKLEETEYDTENLRNEVQEKDNKITLLESQLSSFNSGEDAVKTELNNVQIKFVSAEKEKNKLENDLYSLEAK